MIIGRTDAEAKTLVLWPPDAKSQLIGEDTDTEGSPNFTCALISKQKGNNGF